MARGVVAFRLAAIVKQRAIIMEHSGALFDFDDAENRVVIIPPVIDGAAERASCSRRGTHMP